jgi:hypothetical protein
VAVEAFVGWKTHSLSLMADAGLSECLQPRRLVAVDRGRRSSNGRSPACPAKSDGIPRAPGRWIAQGAAVRSRRGILDHRDETVIEPS